MKKYSAMLAVAAVVTMIVPVPRALLKDLITEAP